jgi:hypothetical protein
MLKLIAFSSFLLVTIFHAVLYAAELASDEHFDILKDNAADCVIPNADAQIYTDWFLPKNFSTNATCNFSGLRFDNTSELPITTSYSSELPFVTDFEESMFYTGFLFPNSIVPDYLFNDLYHWIIQDPYALKIVSDINASGEQSAEILKGYTIDFKLNDSLSTGIRWVDFYVKPIFSLATELPDTIEELRTAVSAFVSQGGKGMLYVVNGNGSGSGAWVSSEYPVVIEGNKSKDWIRMSYRLDYESKTWDLYLDGELVLFDLGFLDHALTHFEQLSLQSSEDNSTHIDFLYVGMENPLFADQDNDGIDDSLDAKISIADRYLDADGDGLINIKEIQLGTALNLSDSDGDGHSDYFEYRWGRDPTIAASDLAQLSDSEAGGYQWATGFEESEGYALALLDRQLDWYASSHVAVTANDSQRAISKANTTAYVERYFNTTSHSQIWFGFSGKFYVGDLPKPENVDHASAVVFGFSAANKVQVLDVQNNRWLFYDLPNPATQWARYAIYFDYTASTWDLYQDGQLVASQLPFTNSSLTALSCFRASIDKLAGSTAASYLDNLKVYAGPDFDQDQLDDVWERQHGFNPAYAEVDARDVRPNLASDAANGYFWETFFEQDEGYRVGPLNYQRGWRSSPNVAVTDDDTQFAEDALATTAYAEHYFDIEGHSEIWYAFSGKFHVGPVPSEDPSANFSQTSGTMVEIVHATENSLEAASASIRIVFGEDGQLSIFDPVYQVWTSHALFVPATEWSRYALHFDSETSTWDLYQEGVKVVSAMPFENVGTSIFSCLRVSLEKSQQSDAASYLDNLKVYSGPDVDADGLDFDFELANGLNPVLNDRNHPDGDFDLDGFKNEVEWRHGTHHLFNYAAENAALQVDTRIEALEPASSLRFFSQQDHTNKMYVRNPEVWCSDIDSITAISPWNSTQGRHRAGTLISPQHLLFAAHYQLGVGTSVRFVTKDNQLVERTVIARKTLAGYYSNGRRNYSKDITIGLLNEPLHADIDGIHFVKVLPDDWADYLGPMDSSSFDPVEAMPALCLDFEEKALITDVGVFSTFVSFTTPALEPRRAYYESKITGDSGNPALLLLNSPGSGAELVLLNVWTFGGAGSGASVYENKAEINQIMAHLEAQKGFNHGYQLTEYDFSGFQALGSL